MPDEPKRNSQTIAAWAQTAMLGATIIAALMHIGKRDAQIDQTTAQVRELSSIVSDLAKSQIGLTIRAEQQENRLLEIASRIDRLEQSKR
jgi:outer membrane murein-binding lipoprotein Lpp